MSVEFQHLGLTITEPSDIREFYQDILGMDIRNKFTLKQNIASQIFHREQDIEVIVGTIGNLSIELFLRFTGREVSDPGCRAGRHRGS